MGDMSVCFKHILRRNLIIFMCFFVSLQSLSGSGKVIKRYRTVTGNSVVVVEVKFDNPKQKFFSKRTFDKNGELVRVEVIKLAFNETNVVKSGYVVIEKGANKNGDFGFLEHYYFDKNQVDYEASFDAIDLNIKDLYLKKRLKPRIQHQFVEEKYSRVAMNLLYRHGVMLEGFEDIGFDNLAYVTFSDLFAGLDTYGFGPDLNFMAKLEAEEAIALLVRHTCRSRKKLGKPSKKGIFAPKHY